MCRWSNLNTQTNISKWQIFATSQWHGWAQDRYHNSYLMFEMEIPLFTNRRSIDRSQSVGFTTGSTPTLVDVLGVASGVDRLPTWINCAGRGSIRYPTRVGHTWERVWATDWMPCVGEECVIAHINTTSLCFASLHKLLAHNGYICWMDKLGGKWAWSRGVGTGMFQLHRPWVLLIKIWINNESMNWALYICNIN